MPSLDPRSGGSLSSTCLLAPCDRGLITCTQASFELLGSWMSTPRAQLQERAGMPCAGLEELSFCSFKWAQNSHPVMLSGAYRGETPSFLWALSGQALELGGQEGEVISHFWCQCFRLSGRWPQPGLHESVEGSPLGNLGPHRWCFSPVTSATDAHGGKLGHKGPARPPSTAEPQEHPGPPLTPHSSKATQGPRPLPASAPWAVTREAGSRPRLAPSQREEDPGRKVP